MPRVIEWTEPPQMDTGAPVPAIEQRGDALALAYFRRSEPPFHQCAVVRFSGVSWLHFGYPNDEGLSEHPFYEIGLRHYAFWEILDSPEVPSGSSQRHWIATFHDETFETVAASATVITPNEPAENTAAIARKYA